MICYDPLWKTMREKGVTKYALIYRHGFSAYTITCLRNNRSITMHTMERLCGILQCTPNEIVEFRDGDAPNG